MSLYRGFTKLRPEAEERATQAGGGLIRARPPDASASQTPHFAFHKGQEGCYSEGTLLHYPGFSAGLYDDQMSKEHYVFRYRVRNWPEYNRALVARGSLTFWFDEESIAVWRQTERREGSGRPQLYSDTTIQCALVLRCVFRLSLRATQGLLASLVELMALDLPVPDYSTVSRR